MTTVDSLQTQINSVITLYSNGQIQEALDSVETLTKNYPNEPLLYNISGVCYKAIGQLDAAVKSFEKALAIKPDYTEVNYNLGLTFQELGQLDAAVKCYEDALVVNPEHAEAHNNLGVTLKELGQLDDAIKSYEKALAIKPDYTEAHSNLGNAFKDLGEPDAAVKFYEKALAANPDSAEAHYSLTIAYNNVGLAFMELGLPDDAIKFFEKALAVNPDSAEAHNNVGIAYAHNSLGTAIHSLGQHEAALKCYKNALAIKPDYADAYLNRGNVLKDLERLDEALASYESAIALNPDSAFILGGLVHTKMKLCLWDDLANRLNELTTKINSSEKVIIPFALLALIDDPEIQKKNSEIYAKERYPQSHVLPKIEPYPKHKKIRIGYFSPDFRIHPVSDLIVELFEIHDRNQFEIYAFSFGPDTKDEMNLRIKVGVDHFHDVCTMSYEDTAVLARSVELDIAVDLGGYTAKCRTGIFAMSVAPIQVSYLGYAGTMATDYMDYLIADRTVIPEEKQHHYSENIAYLPNSYMVNDSKIKLSERVFTRREVGLPIDGFVFCCFNNHYKITPSIFVGWMRILSQVDASVLWLSDTNSTAVNNLKKEVKKHGVDPNRLIFAPHLPFKEDHLNRIQLADLFIDTLPFNAHVTASDALRMGLPVLTCIGSSFASRVAASLLNAVNLPELITSTQEQYESLAIELATHPEKLKIIKEKLVDNLPTAPLYDTQLFAKHLESAYLTMYDRYQTRIRSRSYLCATLGTIDNIEHQDERSRPTTNTN